MKKYHKMTDKQKELVIQFYSEGFSCGQIAKRLKFTRHSISRFLRKNNIKIKFRTCRKYTVNENYFDKIDTEDKAYFLGLMYADGNVSKNTNMSKISLQEQDADILEKFKVYIKSNQPLILEKPKKKYWSNTYKLYVYNKNFRNGLIRNGCFPQKSLILNFPTQNQVSDSLLPHFIRGYFDGDGSLYHYVSLVSSINFINQMIDRINFLNIEYKTVVRKNNKTKVFYITKIESYIKFLDWIYENSNIYLDRKYKIYKIIKSNNKITKNNKHYKKSKIEFQLSKAFIGYFKFKKQNKIKVD